MSNEVSYEDAKKGTLEALAGFDWINFFGKTVVDHFIDSYRALHAQLREGDELKIEVSKNRYEGKFEQEVIHPCLNIVLYSKGKREGLIHLNGLQLVSFRPENLLYDDKNPHPQKQ